MRFYILIKLGHAAISINKGGIYMSIAQDISQMVTILPESEQNMIYELVKRFVLAWDPDYTKLTPQEEKELEEAKNGEYISANDIDWNDLSKYV